MTIPYSNPMQRSHLWLVSAGPGDPDLLTLKAVKAIQHADVILYDSLVHQDVLSHAQPDAELTCVGKRAGMESTPQEGIHQLIGQAAMKGKRIVRLKGGDAMMFGRAGEEMAFADDIGLSWTYVPGISCGTSLAGLAGIPLTMRGVASSVWMGTATDQHGRLAPDLMEALDSSSTLVVFMGRRRILDIARRLVQLGKGDMPIAVISRGSLPNQKMIVHSAHDWNNMTTLPPIEDPALLVVGDVVHSRSDQSTQTLHQLLPQLNTFTDEYQVPHFPQGRAQTNQRLRRI